MQVSKAQRRELIAFDVNATAADESTVATKEEIVSVVSGMSRVVSDGEMGLDANDGNEGDDESKAEDISVLEDSATVDPEADMQADIEAAIDSATAAGTEDGPCETIAEEQFAKMINYGSHDTIAERLSIINSYFCSY